MTMLDLIGPQEALSHLTEVHLVATSVEMMTSDSGVPFQATTTIAGAPADDFGPTLLAEMRDDAAMATQLRLEYDPHPPFDSGSPSTAEESTVAAARTRLEPFNRQVKAVATELTR